MLKCVLLRKLNFTNAQSTSFRQHCGAVSETFLNSSKGAFCCLFFKYLDTRNSYRSFQGGTLTTLSELGFHSLTCHCDQSLRMVFRWRTRDLLPAPPQTGSRHFLLFRVRSRQAQNSRQLPSSSNSSVALHKTTWLVGYLYV